MRRAFRVLTLMLFTAPLFACASGGTPAPGEERDPELITLAEIEASQAETAYQLVQELRPRWMLRNRGPRSFGTGEADFRQVTVDGMPPREFDHLREIPRLAVLEMRLLSPREATFLYGTGYSEGIIKVTTKR